MSRCVLQNTPPRKSFVSASHLMCSPRRGGSSAATVYSFLTTGEDCDLLNEGLCDSRFLFKTKQQELFKEADISAHLPPPTPETGTWGPERLSGMFDCLPKKKLLSA